MTFTGLRSEKSLDLAREFGRYQRTWFGGLRARAAAGDPIAVVNADAPQEIFRALDIPYVVTQWWSSVVAAKQQAATYLSELRTRGYPDTRESYTALAFASTLADDDGNAPWGGLPRPAILHAVASGDAMAKLFEAWAQHSGADCYLIERSTSWRETGALDWWEQSPEHWDEFIEPERLDLLVDELKGLIRFLEQRTGRRWSEPRFCEVLELVNEQAELYRRTRELIATARPAPVSIVDTMPATMVPQWHRGTEWARDAALRLHDGVQARCEAGAAACPEERMRLMWLGVGLWFNMGFYESFQASHGAVFVWSIYLGLAADGYLRRLLPGQDPLRSLAARFVNIDEELRGPGWASEWHVKEARSHGVDGVVALDRVSVFDRLAFKRAGLPVLELGVSNVDPRAWDEARVRGAMTRWLEDEVAPVAAARRARAAGAQTTPASRSAASRSAE